MVGHANGIRAGILARYSNTGTVADNIGADLAFNTAAENGGDGNEKMRITSDGKVGIGTNAPSQLLHVWKAGVLEPLFQSTTGRVGLQLSAGAVGDVSWILYSGYPAAGDFNIRESGVANHLVIKKTTGDATFGGDVVVTGDLTVNGTTTTIDTTNLLIEDPLLLLARTQSGTPTLDSGFIIERGLSLIHI